MFLCVKRSTGKAGFLRPTPKTECPINFSAPVGRWKGFSSVAFCGFDLGSSKNHSCPLDRLRSYRTLSNEKRVPNDSMFLG